MKTVLERGMRTKCQLHIISDILRNGTLVTVILSESILQVSKGFGLYQGTSVGQCILMYFMIHI